ncbi:hypothetical protein NMG60_11021823 [Bertholletia excelsa]
MVGMIGKSLSSAMNARTVGSGDQTLVLGHGYGGDQCMWDKIVPFLSLRYRVLVFDWSFSGAVKDPDLFDPVKYSSFEAFADDLISLLEENNLRDIVFVGHSMPELFKRLILVGASPSFINSEDYEGGFAKDEIEQLLACIENNFHDWVSAFVPTVMGGNDPFSIHYFDKSLKRMNPDTALSVAKLIFLSDNREILEMVMTPCAIIQTTKDPIVPNSVADYMQKKIKGKSTVEIIPIDGHFPQLTAHEQLLDVIGGVLGFDL